MSRTKCTMYFKEMSFTDSILACNDTAANCIKNNASLSNEIATDDPDHNARFIGANPNNYVLFNNELWRIIGVFNNIDNGSGNKEARLKIIRDEPYSTGIAWNTGSINDWSKSSLQQELNTTYFNSIQSLYQEMIGIAIWNLGGSDTYSDVTSSMFYERERGDSVYTGRPTAWTGSIGLMYVSDYGYATSGGSTTNRQACLAKELWNWSTVSDCYNNDWLYNGDSHQWTLTTFSGYSFEMGINVFTVTSIVAYAEAHNTYSNASPVLYLNSSVEISGGTGEKSDPFTLSL